MTRIFRGLVVVGLLALGTPVYADTLIGDTVQSVFQAPNGFPGDNLWDGIDGAGTGTPIAAVVGAGHEYSITLGGIFFANLGANTLSIGIVQGEDLPLGDNVVFDFTDLDWTDLPGSIIGNVSLLNSTFTGVTVTFGPDSIHVEIPDQDVPVGVQTANFLITPGTAAAVPAPATLLLLASVITGLGAVRAWRRR